MNKTPSRLAKQFFTSPGVQAGPQQKEQPSHAPDEQAASQKAVAQPKGKAVDLSALDLEVIPNYQKIGDELLDRFLVFRSKVYDVADSLKNGKEVLKNSDPDRLKNFKVYANEAEEVLQKGQDLLDKISDKVCEGGVGRSACINYEQELMNCAYLLDRCARNICKDDQESAKLLYQQANRLHGAVDVLAKLDARNAFASKSDAQGSGNLSNSVGWLNISLCAAKARRKLFAVEAGQADQFKERHLGTVNFVKHDLSGDMEPSGKQIASTLGHAGKTLDEIRNLGASQASQSPNYWVYNSYQELKRRYGDKNFSLAELDSDFGARILFSEDSDFDDDSDCEDEADDADGKFQGYDEKQHYSLLLKELQGDVGKLDHHIASLRNTGYNDVVSKLQLPLYSQILRDAVNPQEESSSTISDVSGLSQ